MILKTHILKVNTLGIIVCALLISVLVRERVEDL